MLQVSTHESCHGAVALYLGFNIKMELLEPEMDTNNGHCGYTHPTGRNPTPEEQIMIKLGPLVWNHIHDEPMSPGSERDKFEISEILSFMHPGNNKKSRVQRALIFNTLAARVLMIIESGESKINRMAKTLFYTGRVNINTEEEYSYGRE